MDASRARGGEKVGIVGPAGDDMDVEVFWNACTCGGAEVDSDI